MRIELDFRTVRYYAAQMASYKYGRTPHLPFSPAPSADDKRLDSSAHFVGKEVVLLSKMDGSNTAMLQTGCFARSHNNAPKHPSFDLFKQIHNNIKHNIPKNLCIYAEYLLARHSCIYTQLPSYLLVFNVLDIEEGIWLSWNDVERVAGLLQLPTTPLLYRGRFESENALEKQIEALAEQKEFGVDPREGVVIRLADSFPRSEFANSIAKYVNKSFADINKDEHWMHKQVVKNGLKSRGD